MKLSVLLISYNTKNLTVQALRSVSRSLKKCRFAYEILVLDNHSNDFSVKAIKNLHLPFLKLYESRVNLGFGKGNNLLAKKALGQYLLLLNSDTQVLDSAIEKLLEFAQHHQEFDFVGGKLLNPDLTPQASCGPLYSPWVIFLALFLKGDYFQITRYSPNKTRQVGWITGACIMTKKTVFMDLSGFDESIFMYMEEIDLFKRAKHSGMKVGFYPEAVFIHHGFASSGTKSAPVINVFKGIIYYYQKHYRLPARLFIHLLLKTKAVLGYTVGVLINNVYLKETYGQAYKITGSKI